MGIHDTARIASTATSQGETAIFYILRKRRYGSIWHGRDTLLSHEIQQMRLCFLFLLLSLFPNMTLGHSTLSKTGLREHKGGAHFFSP